MFLYLIWPRLTAPKKTPTPHASNWFLLYAPPPRGRGSKVWSYRRFWKVNMTVAAEETEPGVILDMVIITGGKPATQIAWWDPSTRVFIASPFRVASSASYLLFVPWFLSSRSGASLHIPAGRSTGKFPVSLNVVSIILLRSLPACRSPKSGGTDCVAIS